MSIVNQRDLKTALPTSSPAVRAALAAYVRQVTAAYANVESAFSQDLVKPGRIEPEFSRLYQRARRQREEADYAEESVIDEATARQTLADAERFVERLERFLREVAAL